MYTKLGKYSLYLKSLGLTDKKTIQVITILITILTFKLKII